MSDDIATALGEPFPGETLIADGWQYRDMPSRVTPEVWAEWLAIMGEGNYRILIMTSFEDATGRTTAVRGQFFISPTGMENMQRYLDSRKP